MHRFVRIRSLLLALLGAVLLATPVRAQNAAQAIRLNQVGYYPDAPKTAAVVDAPGAAFEVRRAADGSLAFSGTLGTEKTWTPSGERARLADFTALSEPGTYVLHVPGLGDSHPFDVAPAAHLGVARAALKAYYFMRASTALDPAYAGRWARAAGHPDDAVRVHPSAATEARPAGTRVAAPKGWYDAGDYNKYVVNAGISTGTLLMLFEHYPDYFEAFETGIPESGDAVPDVLDEVLWNLRWMLAMQDPNDGGVYHKLTTPNFEGDVMPVRATQPRYVVQKSTPATLDFAAVAALAARVYDDYEGAFPGLADSLVAAARAAWDWAEAHPNVRYDQNAMNAAHDPDVWTGEYGDGTFADEFRWAAAELFLTTGETAYVDARAPDAGWAGVPGWPNVGTMAYYSLLHHRSAAVGAVDVAALERQLLGTADALVSTQQASAFDVAMGGEGFWWGSNGHAANQGMLLLRAHALTGEARYLDAALSNLDYLLGRNGTGFSFLTGHGDRTPMHPHHRPSEADGVAEPVPGLLVGGPHAGGEDVGPNTWQCPDYRGAGPGSSYIDDWCSYATNEVTINWNAPLAYLAGATEAIRAPGGAPVAVEDALPDAPAGLALDAYPNPTRADAVAAFRLAAPADVRVAVYDLLGREVARPVDGARLGAGAHAVPLGAEALAAGAYVVHVRAGTASSTRLLHVLGR